MAERAPDITRFEASCTSDIVGIDHLTHTLKRAIEHFGQSELGQLRFVTKFHHVDHLLDAKHNGRTRFRFSVNADYVIKHFEPGTSPLEKRIEALGKWQELDTHSDLLLRQSIFMMAGRRAIIICLSD